MKKILVAFGAFAMAFAATADLDTLITFSTKGPDKYLDGNTVMDGECYALVWAKTGSEFKGLTADGKCVDEENNALVLVAPIAKDGHCPPVMYVVKATDANFEKYKGGDYGIYLLDTRVAKTETDANGESTTTYTLAGLQGGKPKAVNGLAAVQEGVKSDEGELASATTSGSVTVVNAAPPPADAPKPEIKAIKIVGDNVFLTVANTVPYIQYNAAASDTPDVGSANAGKPQSGNSDEDITIVVPKQGDKGFFKIKQN